MQIALVLGILIAALILFVSERVPVDLVSVGILIALVVFGLVTPDEAIAGFSNQATITVAAMFILSAGLVRTGVISTISEKLVLRGRGNETKVLLMLMLIVGLSSGFINNTAAVAVMLPATLRIAREMGMSPSKLLIPLSFSAMMGGSITLLGTSTNILVHSISLKAGYDGISMFELARLGLILFAVGVVYLLYVAPRVLPDRVKPQRIAESYKLKEYFACMRVPEGSPLIGMTLNDAGLMEGKENVRILGIMREDQRIWTGIRTVPLHSGDILQFEGSLDDIIDLRKNDMLLPSPTSEPVELAMETQEVGLTEGLISERSPLIGQTLHNTDIRNRYGVFVLALRRPQETYVREFGHIHLRFGDVLLLQGPRERLAALEHGISFLMLNEVERSVYRKSKLGLALGIIAGVVLLAALNVLSIVVSAIAGAVLMVTLGILERQEAYEAVDWSVILLLAGILPLGTAMQNSGAADLIAASLMNAAQGAGPYLIIAGLYFLTSLMTAIMSNNASAVLVAPIAISVAQVLGISAQPLIIAITFAASASFATPIGYQTNTMVYGPGGYRFSDFTRVGLPLSIIFGLIATLLIPVFWPL